MSVRPVNVLSISGLLLFGTCRGSVLLSGVRAAPEDNVFIGIPVSDSCALAAYSMG